MTDVATSELRAHLSEWIRRAREGEDVVITDRGVPVARILPVDAESTLQRLMREGVISPPRSTKPFRAADQPRVHLSGDRQASDYITMMRGDDDEWP
ncbi:MAG TPA: type II toxin-antitoxin system prevent-host-death family antitoxin [Iamia sp.]